MQQNTLSDFRKKSWNLARLWNFGIKLSRKNWRPVVKGTGVWSWGAERGVSGTIWAQMPIKKVSKKGKIRGTLVRLLWRAADVGLKPLRLPHAHLPHPRVNTTCDKATLSFFIASILSLSLFLSPSLSRERQTLWPQSAFFTFRDCACDYIKVLWQQCFVKWWCILESLWSNVAYGVRLKDEDDDCFYYYA